MTDRKTVDEFLSRKRVAVIGVSRQSRDFTRAVFREFSRRGYEVVPVNPHVAEVEGRRCFAQVQDIDPPVEAALVMTPARGTDRVVRDCAQAGISLVWLYRAAGEGAVSAGAVEFCRENGIRVVEGHCPLMFWQDAAFIHKLHGLGLKLTGRYPR